MNRIYRLVFNTSLGLVQVVSELGSKEGGRHDRRKSLRGKDTAPTRTPIALAIALALGMMAPLVWTAPAQAVTNVPGAPGNPGGDATVGAAGIGGPSTGGGTYLNYGGDGGYYSYGIGGGGGGGYGPGGNGGVGGYSPTFLIALYGGGGGGGGGPAYFLKGGSVTLGSAYYLAGGAGGKGGNAYNYLGGGYYGAQGGVGGGGGAGVGGVGFSLTATYGDIRGGTGGTGGNGTGGATGGIGGAGIFVIPGGSGTYINNGSAGGSTSGIYGGAGGHGGAPTGSGGSAGSGIVGNNMTVVNGANGLIYGGKGGVGYVSGSDGGSGGFGIYSRGSSTIVNSGYIGGGTNGAGVYYTGPNYAVFLTGGRNTLKILSGSYFHGNVTSFPSTTYGGDTLELSGTSNATLAGTFSNKSTGLGSFVTAPVFGGFQTLKKTGASNWTITNGSTTTLNPNAIPNWDVEAGTLALSSGDNFTAAATHTLTFGIKSNGTMSTIPGVDNGTIVVPGTATLSNEKLKINLAYGTYVSGVSYTLMTATSFDAAPGVTFNPSLPSGMSCSDAIDTSITPNSLTLTCATGGTLSSPPPPSGGGGAFGLLSLFGLLGMAGLGRRSIGKNRKRRGQQRVVCDE